jgi:predicted CoA-binding protein
MLSNKPTVVIGASPNADRYSYKATASLQRHHYQVYPIGIKQGQINGLGIIIDKPLFQNIDTVTLYVGPNNQSEWIDYIFALNPKRIIFNPGTENPDFQALAELNGIEVLEACTLVLLSINQY